MGAWLAWSAPAFSAAAPAPADASRPAAQYAFATFGMEAGLPGAAVTAALQTRDGYLWVATGGGLARFDGVRFVSFREANTPALPSNLINCLFEDRAGVLWIGTERGLVRCQNGVFTGVGPPGISVRAITQDDAGRIWFGAYAQGLFSWQDGQLQRYDRAPGLASKSILSLCADAAGRLWIGTGTAGVVCLEHGRFQPFADNAALGERIEALCEQPRGVLWVGTHARGLFRLQAGSLARFDTRNGLARELVSGLRADPNGGVWIADGAWQKIADPAHPVIRTLSQVAGVNIVGLTEDREGSLWLCANEAGLIRAHPLPYRLISTASGLPGNRIKAVTEDAAGRIWLAVQNRGVAEVAPDGAVTVHPQPADPALAYAAADGRLWLGGGAHGIELWRQGAVAQTFPELHSVRGIYEDRGGVMWLGQDQGLARFQNGRLTPAGALAGFAIPHATSFDEGPDGALFIGTWAAGLFELKDGKVTVFNHRNGLPTDEVRAVYADPDGRVWVGLRGRGLALRQDGRWLNPSPLIQAVADNVSAIAGDDRGRIWLGTPAGIMWAKKDELLAAMRGARPDVSVLHLVGAFHATPVLSGAEPGVWQTRDGKLLFATQRGAVVIDPEHLPLNEVPPPVRIEQVALDQRDTGATDRLKIPPGTREVAIEYTALSFIEPRRVFFQYRLEGYDRGWVNAGARRTAFYANLPPGDYVFRVRACNNDGVWNDAGAELALIQEPHFYQTWWFYALVLAGLGALGLGGHRWRTAALRRENERLERGIRERTRELALSNTAKSEFLDNISHEIRNPLNGIVGLIAMLDEHSLAGPQREQAQSLKACAQDLSRVFDEVLNFSKLEYGYTPLHERAFALAGLARETQALFLGAAARQGSTLALRLPADLADGFYGDDAKIKTILGNFVGNALKYAPGTPAEIAVTCAEADAAPPPSLPAGAPSPAPPAARRAIVRIEVSDRGPGVPPEERELIFRKFIRGARAKRSDVAGAGIGLATCRVMAQILGGTVGLKPPPAAPGGADGAGRGATFFLQLTLPRVPLPAGAAAAPTADVPPETRARALIVEDQDYNQVVLAGLARRLGYEPACAADAAAAFALVGRQRFDVVFLDLELPGIKGPELARRLRARPGGQTQVLIGASAHDSHEAAQASLAAGMDAFLPKPLSEEKIRTAIAEARSRRNGTAAGADGIDCASLELYARTVVGGMAEAARIYLRHLQEEIDALRAALDGGSAADLARAAHRVRSHAALIGATELGRAAAELGKAVLAGEDATVADCFRRIEQLAADAARQLKARVASSARECA